MSRASQARRSVRGGVRHAEGLRHWHASVLLTAILLLAFLMGGSARHDVASLIVLRPLSAIMAGLALYFAVERNVLRQFAPFWFLIALAALIALQLVPLPPTLWHMFPGRELILHGDVGTRLGDNLWRPLSLVPSRTYNALFSLAVPFSVLAAMSLFNDQERLKPDWQLVPAVLLCLGLTSVLWGALQLVGARGGALYTYRITNGDVPVGPFANRNHQAIYCASLIPLIAWQFVFGASKRFSPSGGLVIATLSIIFVFLMALLTGSRTGSALALLGVIGFIILVGFRMNWGERRQPARRALRPVLTTVLIGAAVVASGLAAWLYTGAEVFDRLIRVDVGEDVRRQTLPYLWEMLRNYFPVGSGFGSFEFVYRIIEPHELVRRQYLNQAHNDPLQFVIEGGMLGAALLAAFAFWFVRTGYRLFTRLQQGERHPIDRRQVTIGLAAFSAAAVLMFGSLTDYPLRTPFGMAYFAALCGLMARATLRGRPEAFDHRSSGGNG